MPKSVKVNIRVTNMAELRLKTDLMVFQTMREHLRACRFAMVCLYDLKGQTLLNALTNFEENTSYMMRDEIMEEKLQDIVNTAKIEVVPCG